MIRKKCKDGSYTHNSCEVIDSTVVCHDCRQTLGRKCEVYSRPCGYLRPTDGFNPGKKAEFAYRKNFLMPTPR